MNFARVVLALASPTEHPLRRVTIYYVVLACALGLWAWASPETFEAATAGPDRDFAVEGRLDALTSRQPAPGLNLGPAELLRVFAALLSALLIMLPVSWGYMSTRMRGGFDQSVVQTMLILPIAVAGIVMVVHDSIALAFSLAGIVAAVRFRNSLRDTADALYIFLAIGAGLACGVGALQIAVLVSIFFNYVVLTLWHCDYGVCPQTGPREGYSSGELLAMAGVGPDAFPGSAGANGGSGGSRKKGGKGKKKKHKKAMVMAAAAAAPTPGQARGPDESASARDDGPSVDDPTSAGAADPAERG